MSEVVPDLVVDSVTGIEVALPVAGPGARAYAYLIDWTIKLALALAWYVVAALIYNGRLSLAAPLTSEARWFGAVVVPALAIYFLYHLAVEPAMRGLTPGKRRVGIRVVTRNGSAPSIGVLLVRNVFRLIDSLPALYGLGLTVMVLTRESLRCGDMAAGTLVVYERTGADLELPQGAAARIGTLDSAGAEIVADLLQRWPELVPSARQHLARQVLQRYLGQNADLSETDDLTWRARLERLARLGSA